MEPGLSSNSQRILQLPTLTLIYIKLYAIYFYPLITTTEQKIQPNYIYMCKKTLTEYHKYHDKKTEFRQKH